MEDHDDTINSAVATALDAGGTTVNVTVYGAAPPFPLQEILDAIRKADDGAPRVVGGSEEGGYIVVGFDLGEPDAEPVLGKIEPSAAPEKSAPRTTLDPLLVQLAALIDKLGVDQVERMPGVGKTTLLRAWPALCEALLQQETQTAPSAEVADLNQKYIDISHEAAELRAWKEQAEKTLDMQRAELTKEREISHYLDARLAARVKESQKLQKELTIAAMNAAADMRTNKALREKAEQLQANLNAYGAEHEKTCNELARVVNERAQLRAKLAKIRAAFDAEP